MLDPFCGTGTTPLIASYEGFETTAVEINPFLVWLSEEVATVAERIRTVHPENEPLMANYVLKYFEDMRQHISNLTCVLRQGARIHYIVGNSSFYGILVPAERVLARIFCEHGFEQISIAPIRKRNCKHDVYEYEITGTYAGA